jgi:hypothetical protein
MTSQGQPWALRRAFPLCIEPTPAGTPGRPHAVHAARQVAAGLARTHALTARPRPRRARPPHGSRDVVLHLKHIEPVVAPFHARRQVSLSPLPRTPVRA